MEDILLKNGHLEEHAYIAYNKKKLTAVKIFKFKTSAQ
jgi:hypothetical protein